MSDLKERKSKPFKNAVKKAVSSLDLTHIPSGILAFSINRVPKPTLPSRQLIQIPTSHLGHTLTYI
jgi:hypothetical protein